jgi:peroxiredoxin (alkyl hydroperoxide reductase subunit C)
LKAYQADIAKFEQASTQVLGISVDSSPANKVFAKQEGLSFPLLSDFQRTVSQQYGILNEQHGFANRTTFVVDKEGIIQHIEKDAAAIDPSGAHAVCSLLEHRKQ